MKKIRQITKFLNHILCCSYIFVSVYTYRTSCARVCFIYALYIVLAQDLYEDSAQGDEPEPLEVVKHKLSDLEELVYNQDLTDSSNAKSISGKGAS
jgi:hypothetical protein